MKYIAADVELLTVKGELFLLDGEPATFVDTINLCVDNFLPLRTNDPAASQVLTDQDWRSINKTLGVLEAEPNDGYFAFEDKDFQVLKKLMRWTAPLYLRRNSPQLVDILEAATGEHPE